MSGRNCRLPDVLKEVKLPLIHLLKIDNENQSITLAVSLKQAVKN